MATIDKLQSLYQQLDTLTSAGEDVVADIRKEINNLELTYLKEEILPQVVASLGVKIKNLRCGLDCSIQFDEEGVINYSFCTTGSMLMIKDSVDAKSCVEATHTPIQPIETKFEIDATIFTPTIPNVHIEQKNNETIGRKVIASDLDGFKSYLKTLKSQTGKSYSNSSIKLYAGSLHGEYVRRIVAQYTPTENIEDISSFEILREIWQKVDSDSLNGKANRSVALAVKMYVDYRTFECELRGSLNEQIVNSSRSNSITHTSTKRKPIDILSITAEHIHITEGNPTSMIVQFINEIGPELVANMHINYLGGELVSIIPNPKYTRASKRLNNGYWINTNSSTRTKIEQIKTICDNLDINVNIELGDSTFVENHSDFFSYNGRTLFSLNGHTPLNKRQSVLACVRLFMALNPNITFEVVERNFPSELQGSYGVVAKLAKVNSRIAQGYDDNRRYFLDKDKILKTKDGVEFAVCHQWGNQFPKFQEHVKKRFGWTLEEVK